MFNLKIPIDENNLEILFANALVENLRYGIISLDTMFYTKFEGKCVCQVKMLAKGPQKC